MFKRLLRRWTRNTPPADPDFFEAAPEVISPWKVVAALRGRLCELGFHDRALRDLKHMATQAPTAKERGVAAYELAFWFSHLQETSAAVQALRWIKHLRNNYCHIKWHIPLTILEAEAFLKQGRRESALNALSAQLQKFPNDRNLLLAKANAANQSAFQQNSQAKAKLDTLNKLFQMSNMSSVDFDVESDASPIDCIRGKSQERFQMEISPDVAMVSIIVPFFNAESTIRTALESLLSQTWHNIEILAVDDQSTDSSCDVVREFAERDPRVTLLHTPFNAGPYVARNLALTRAQGEFITCHDADDWSHPQKIEIQVGKLIQSPSATLANISMQTRAFSNLSFYRRGNRQGYVAPNCSSLLFRKSPVFEALGFWDSVRFGADDELLSRLYQIFGSESVLILDNYFCSIQRQHEESLTGNPLFGFHGWPFGVRLAYKLHSEHDHKNSDSLKYSKVYELSRCREIFPISIENQSRAAESLDLVIAFNFPVASMILSELKNRMEQREHLRFGLVAIPKYIDNHVSSNHPWAPATIMFPGQRLLQFGENVRTEQLWILSDGSLQMDSKHLPAIEASQVNIYAPCQLSSAACGEVVRQTLLWVLCDMAPRFKVLDEFGDDLQSLLRSG